MLFYFIYSSLCNINNDLVVVVVGFVVDAFFFFFASSSFFLFLLFLLILFSSFRYMSSCSSAIPSTPLPSPIPSSSSDDPSSRELSRPSDAVVPGLPTPPPRSASDILSLSDSQLAQRYLVCLLFLISILSLYLFSFLSLTFLPTISSLDFFLLYRSLIFSSLLANRSALYL